MPDVYASDEISNLLLKSFICKYQDSMDDI